MPMCLTLRGHRSSRLSGPGGKHFGPSRQIVLFLITFERVMTNKIFCFDSVSVRKTDIIVLLENYPASTFLDINRFT